MEDASGLALIVVRVVLISALLKLAVDNARGMVRWGDRDWWPEISCALAVLLAYVYDIGLVGAVMETAPKDVLLAPGNWLDNLVTGMAFAGGAGKLADALKEAAERNREIHEANLVRIKNGHAKEGSSNG